jgi:hypothetical protein
VLRRLLVLASYLSFSLLAAAQHRPYFVTYNHEMEEVGNLEINNSNTFGSPPNGNNFYAHQLELEYGATGWWSTAIYLDGQTTSKESSVFTGYRWENRFRLLKEEHLINPVLYVEYAHVRGSDKMMQEIVGHDVEADQAEPNRISHGEIEKEIETKLILSSHVKGWNLATNFIAEKNLAHEPWEFGYAMGASRALSFKPSGSQCRFCAENIQLGAELYGGLGDAKELTLRDTSHYFAPVFAWKMSDATNLRLSPSFGLTAQSHTFLMRVGVTYEIDGFGSKVKRMFAKR